MKRTLEMSADEIVVSYRQSKNKGQQLGILAQLNMCKPWEIIWILVENGIDPRSFNKVATLRNAYEKAKEKGLQLPKKSVSEIVEEIQPEEASEQEEEQLTEEHPEPDQSEEDSRIVNIPVDSFASEEPEEIQIPEETVMLESYENAIETLNKEIAYLQEKNKEYLEKIQELHESARRSKAEALELRERLDGIGETIEKKDASIQHLLSENSDLKNSLYNREEKIEELEKKIKHLKTSDFNSTIDGMVSESKLSTANERIKELEKELSFYEDEKDGDGLTIAALKHENEELKTKVTAAEHYILNMLVYGKPFS